MKIKTNKKKFNEMKLHYIQKKRATKTTTTTTILRLIYSFKSNLFPRFLNRQEMYIFIRGIFFHFSYILWCKLKKCNHFKRILHEGKKDKNKGIALILWETKNNVFFCFLFNFFAFE